MNQVEDMLETSKQNGVNVIRLRLFKDPQPALAASSFQKVKQLSSEIRSKGMKVLLSVHFSDTWADPSQQTVPLSWGSLSFEHLKDSVAVYTQKIMHQIQPDYIQIGNEINNGLLFPHGQISNLTACKELLTASINKVRTIKPNCKIILHYAGHQDADTFFAQFSDLDYDIAGISYYPMWHGKDLIQLRNHLQQIATSTSKKVLVAETSYPFTLGWYDQTHNVVGLSEQILS